MPICFIQLEYFRTKKIAHLIASLIGFFVILFAGARGPVICILITISIYILLNIKIKDIKKVPVVFILVIITRMIYLKFDQIIMSLSQILLKYGIESRTARLLLEDNFFVSLQRKEIWKILIDNIRIIGYGFYGDRAIVGFYAHNIVIELLINFGLLLGIAIIVGLILLIFKGCISNNELMKQLSIVFLSTGFIKLFFSGSYLQEPSFYILIGLGVNSIMDRKIYRRCKWQSKIQRFQHQKQGEITMEVRRL